MSVKKYIKDASMIECMGRNGFSIDDIVDMNYLGRLDKLVFRISSNYPLDLQLNIV